MKLALLIFIAVSFIALLTSIVYRVIRETIYYWTLSISDYRRTLSNLMHVHLKPKAKQRLYRIRVLYAIYSAISIAILIVGGYLVSKTIIERSL